MRLFDAHNHLQDSQLTPALPAIVSVLKTLPLAEAVVNGTREADWPRVAALAEEHPWVLPSYGLHPWWLAERSPHWKRNLEERVERALVAGERVGIGETGLDRWMDGYDIEAQVEALRFHIRLATQYNLPLSLHCLRAWGQMLTILQEEEFPSRGFLLHAYGGPVEMVHEFVALGAYFSFSGNFLGRERKCAPFIEIPPERLLAETDAPAMPLPAHSTRFTLSPPHSGEEPLNHPGNIIAVYEGLAKLRGWPLPEAARQLGANYTRLFGLIGLAE